MEVEPSFTTFLKANKIKLNYYEGKWSITDGMNYLFYLVDGPPCTGKTVSDLVSLIKGQTISRTAAQIKKYAIEVPEVLENDLV